MRNLIGGVKHKMGVARTRLVRLIAPRERDRGAEAYYPQQRSCQISHLWFLYERFLGQREEGSFIEVGAHDGVTASNSWGLSERGWWGWMIEPVPEMANRCRSAHRDHPRVQVVPCAITRPGVSEITLFVADTLTTSNEQLFEEYHDIEWAKGALTDDQVTVPAMSLSEFLEVHGVPREVDVLIVDTEGSEREVFSGVDLGVFRPKMMIIELVDTHPDLRSTVSADADLGRRVVSSGYEIVFKDSINTVFLRTDIFDAAHDPVGS
jgi:FkbM family methyltransferase